MRSPDFQQVSALSRLGRNSHDRPVSRSLESLHAPDENQASRLSIVIRSTGVELNRSHDSHTMCADTIRGDS